MDDGTGSGSMVQVQSLGEAWQRKNLSRESPFDIGRRVEHYQRKRIIFLLVSAVILALALLGIMIVTDVPLHMDTAIPLVVLMTLAAGLYFVAGGVTPAHKQWFVIWEEFKRHHDYLVKELCIKSASTSLSDIVNWANKRLVRQRDEIRYKLKHHTSVCEEAQVPSVDHMKVLYTETVEYWRLRRACEYLGLIDEEEVVVTLDPLFTPIHLGQRSAGRVEV